MRAEELKNGLVVCHVEHDRLYFVEECNMRMKDSQKGWIDAVCYVPLYNNDYDAFCREKASFLEEFEVDKLKRKMAGFEEGIDMRFQDDEYILSYVPDEITITKEALEKWRDHYLKVAVKYKNEPFKWGLYLGKADAIIEILKHFDEMEV